MKKIALLSIIFVLCCSCRIIKQLNFTFKAERMMKKTERNYNYGTKFPFKFERDAILIPCKMDDTTHLLYYNSAVEGLLHGEIPANTEFPQCKKTVKIRMKDSSKQSTVYKIGLKYYYMESDFFHFNNMVGIVTSVLSDTIIPMCMSEKKITEFLIGREFSGTKNAMLLSFSDTTITLFDAQHVYDTTGFTPMKLFNSCRGFSVGLTLDSVEYAFVFNTGYEGALGLPQHKKYQECAIVEGKAQCVFFDVQYEKHKKEKDLCVARCREQNALKTIIDTLILQQTNTISMGDLDAISGDIRYAKGFSRPVMGMGFIAHFDWILDIDKGKIYAKKILNIDSFFNPYRVSIFENSLQISSAPLGEPEYQLFSIIDSVNGEKINTENICQMKEILNRKNGFRDNKIMFIQP